MTSLEGIPVVVSEDLGPEPFCKLFPMPDLLSLPADIFEGGMPTTDTIVCNPAGLELLKKEMAKR